MDLKGALYFMLEGNIPFHFLILQELRRQVVSGLSPAHCGVSEEPENLLSRLMTVNPRYRLTGKDMMKKTRGPSLIPMRN